MDWNGPRQTEWTDAEWIDWNGPNGTKFIEWTEMDWTNQNAMQMWLDKCVQKYMLLFSF